MPANHRFTSWTALRVLGLVVLATASTARAQDAVSPATGTTNSTWQNFDWLQASENAQHQAASGATVKVTSGPDLKDAHTVVSSGALWQEKDDAVYTQRLGDPLALTFDNSATRMNEVSDPTLSGGWSDDVYRGQKVSLQIQPVQAFTCNLNIHDAMADASLTGDSTVSGGAGFSAEGHLPLNSVLTFNLNSDRSGAGAWLSEGSVTTTTDYNAQLSQPLGKFPLTAMLKGHYEQIGTTGAPSGRMPSLEQSLVWKPIQDTTLQMGLRQQQYEEYPGINNQFNEALFADWSQSIVGSVSWHSYAEVLNSRSLIDQAPIGTSTATSGANGTPQATPPGSNASLTSSLPISIEDQTLTFSTGPSILLQKDISASLEYSDRWDRSPAPGSLGQEQRVSLSLKGTF